MKRKAKSQATHSGPPEGAARGSYATLQALSLPQRVLLLPCPLNDGTK